MKTINKDLEKIYQEQKELSIYGGIGALLGWDQLTYMPPDGAEDRGNQLALLSKLSHEKVVSDEFYTSTQNLADPKILSILPPNDQIVVTRLIKDLDKARKIPSWFVEKTAKTTTMAYAAWEQARTKKSYQLFAPHLQEVIELQQTYCEFIKKPGHPYNSLLDDYEEGMTTDVLTKEFSILKKQLQDLLHEIQNSRVYAQQKTITHQLSKKQQQTLSDLILSQMQLPEKRFRIDISTHPFTTALSDNDVRITTNYNRPNPLFSLFSTIHEAGHALYELGLPKNQYKDTVISDSASVGLHESQSRFWENMIGRNKFFWTFFLPRCSARFFRFFNSYTLDSWYQQINQIHPSLIRVEADEVTYCLHVILRYELELALINGTISVDELPQMWNEKMLEYLELTPPNDVEGVLQDMHWSGGSFGYFPTYAIGTIYAAQLYNQLLKDHPETAHLLTKGDLGLIIEWLYTNIHQYGRELSAEAIIKKTCATGLNAQTFIQYLKNKYYDLYSIS